MGLHGQSRAIQQTPDGAPSLPTSTSKGCLGIRYAMDHFTPSSVEGPVSGPVETAVGAVEDETTPSRTSSNANATACSAYSSWSLGIDRRPRTGAGCVRRRMGTMGPRGARWTPEAYLYRTAMNAFRKRYAARQILRRVTGSVAGRATAPQSGSRLELDETLRALTPRQRAALVLTELLGYNASEVAARCSASRPRRSAAQATRPRPH